MGINSHQKRIEEYLFAGNELTALEALHRFGCFRLAVVIERMKKKYGPNIIERELIPKPPNGRTHYARYRVKGQP